MINVTEVYSVLRAFVIATLIFGVATLIFGVATLIFGVVVGIGVSSCLMSENCATDCSPE